jgi:hypothetical protein
MAIQWTVNRGAVSRTEILKNERRTQYLLKDDEQSQTDGRIWRPIALARAAGAAYYAKTRKQPNISGAKLRKVGRPLLFLGGSDVAARQRIALGIGV